MVNVNIATGALILVGVKVSLRKVAKVCDSRKKSCLFYVTYISEYNFDFPKVAVHI